MTKARTTMPTNKPTIMGVLTDDARQRQTYIPATKKSLQKGGGVGV